MSSHGHASVPILMSFFTGETHLAFNNLVKLTKLFIAYT